MNILFKALDDPTRRKILDMLKSGDLSAGEIAAAFDMAKPSISHHLDILKQSKLVISIKKGQFVYYSLNTTVLDDTISWLFGLKNKKILEKPDIETIQTNKDDEVKNEN